MVKYNDKSYIKLEMTAPIESLIPRPIRRFPKDIPRSYTCGWKLKDMEYWEHITLTRVGYLEWFSKSDISDKLRNTLLRPTVFEVIGKEDFSTNNHVLIVRICDKSIFEKVHRINYEFGHKERTGDYYPTHQKKFHISFRANKDRRDEMAQKRFFYATSLFIKRETTDDDFYFNEEINN